VLLNLVENCVCYSLGLSTPTVKVSYNSTQQALAFVVSNIFFSMTQKQEEKLFTKHCRCPDSVRAHPNGFGMGLYHSMAVTRKIPGGSLNFHQKVQEKFDNKSEFTFTLEV